MQKPGDRQSPAEFGAGELAPEKRDFERLHLTWQNANREHYSF
jgi:hypothetical protein